MLDLTSRLLNNGQHFLIVVILDRLCEGIKQVLLIQGCLIRHWANVRVLHLDVKALLLG